MVISRDCNGNDPRVEPTVLVVEDEPLVRAMIVDYLRDCGFRVVETANADDAIKVLLTDLRIDVVFSDVQMPGTLDGFGLAQWIGREQPNIRIILTSGLGRTAAAASELCGAGPLMSKPYNYGDVEGRIRSLLAC
jgi:CheY-like chemotaxis protein